jgi:hypothetical protein
MCRVKLVWTFIILVKSVAKGFTECKDLFSFFILWYGVKIKKRWSVFQKGMLTKVDIVFWNTHKQQK